MKNMKLNIKSQVPNTITLLNLFCGCIAAVFAFKLAFEMAFLFVCLGIFLDFFDGFFARLFRVSSPLGLQLDSLADMVTSGFVPGLVMYFMMKFSSGMSESSYFPFLGFIITMGSCYRLANFNIDTRQTDSFIGLPTPANALFIISLQLVKTNNIYTVELFTNQWFLLLITLFSAYILNAEIPLFSLKIKNFSLLKYKLQVGFLLFSIMMLAFLYYLAVPIIIISYILLSVFHNKLQKK